MCVGLFLWCYIHRLLYIPDDCTAHLTLRSRAGTCDHTPVFRHECWIRDQNALWYGLRAGPDQNLLTRASRGRLLRAA